MKSKWWNWAGLGMIAVVSIAVLYWTLLYFTPRDLSVPALTESESVHAPVFSPSGGRLYFLKRNSTGMVSGPGIEFFTPPAKVEFLSDRISLVEMQVPTRQSSTVCTWEIPHAERVKFEYRNRLFGIVHSELRWESESLKYKIGADVLPDPPSTVVPEWKVGTWNPLTKGCMDTQDWDRAPQTANPWNEDTVSKDQEVFSFGYDQAIASYFQDGHFRVYYDSLHRPDSVVIEDLRRALSAGQLQFHRERYERIRVIENTQAELVRQFRSQGMNETGALLAAIDELERLGYYPKTPRITAGKVSSPIAGLSTIEIEEMQFEFGLLPDILEAIQNPGKRVRFQGDYLTNGPGYRTREKLNELIGSGQREFLVKTSGGGLFKLSIDH